MLTTVLNVKKIKIKSEKATSQIIKVRLKLVSDFFTNNAVLIAFKQVSSFDRRGTRKYT